MNQNNLDSSGGRGMRLPPWPTKIGLLLYSNSLSTRVELPESYNDAFKQESWNRLVELSSMERM